MLKLKFCFIAALALLALTSGSIKEDRTGCLAPVHVKVSNFSLSFEDFPNTKATQAVADYNGIKTVTLAFYDGSTQVYKTTQLRSDATTYTTFGEFSLSLPRGSYAMVVLAQGISAEETTLALNGPTSATFGGNPIRETFTATQTVDINGTEAVDISTTLNRIFSKLQVVSSDNRVAGANKVRMTFAAGGKAFNPTTGLATENSGFSNPVTTSTAAGEISRSNSYLFLTTDEQTMNVTIETLDDNDNVLLSKTVTDVPFKRNRVTVLTGSLYTNDSVGASFQAETGWIDDYNGTF